jgi:hypothetical protein
MKHTNARLRAEVIGALGGLHQWAKRCHEAAVAVVRHRSMRGRGARVARGWHPATTSQHSWIVLGNPYDEDATIIDPTIWSYRGELPDVEIGPANKLGHRPHGAGSIWDH